MYCQENIYDRIFAESSRIMLKIGLKANLDGYKYLRDAICLVCYDSQLLECVRGGIYTPIAQKYNKKVHCVERSMRNCIELAWTYGDIDEIETIFGYTVGAEKGKPTATEFIALIADRIRINI